jgi:ferredoxin
MRLELNAEVCTGHGRCYALAPEVFEPDDEGHCVIVVDGEVPAEMEAGARKGVANCPEGALSLSD